MLGCVPDPFLQFVYPPSANQGAKGPCRRSLCRTAGSHAPGMLSSHRGALAHRGLARGSSSVQVTRHGQVDTHSYRQTFKHERPKLRVPVPMVQNLAQGSRLFSVGASETFSAQTIFKASSRRSSNHPPMLAGGFFAMHLRYADDPQSILKPILKRSSNAG